MILPTPENQLTKREKQVAELVKQGKSNAIIAYELDLREGTVKFHLTNIYRKLGLKSRTQLALLSFGASNASECGPVHSAE